MMISIPLIAIAMGLLLSPESLTILGNNMGIAGASFLIFLLTGLVVHLFTAVSFGELFSSFHGQGGEARFMKEALGPVPAIALPLCSRVLFTICAATGILATAGYIFNEVFVYWFPNLGFSFCLLGFLLIINLTGHEVSRAAQISFVGTALSGLLILSAVGFLGLGKGPSAFEASNQSAFAMSRVVLLGLVLFIGFDLAGFAKENNAHHPVGLMKSMTVGIVFVGIVLSLWGLASIAYVPPERLADTTVPHMVAARKILGQNGRVIMGLVVLAGSCGAVNALLMAVSRMISSMAIQGLLPPFLGLAPDRAPVPRILLTTGIAAMLAGGTAGEPGLEVYTRAGIWFWLLNYAAIHLAILIMRRRYPNRSYPFQIPWSPVIPIIGLLALLMGLAGLLWTDPQAAQLLKFILVLLVTVSIFSLLWVRVVRRG